MNCLNYYIYFISLPAPDPLSGRTHMLVTHKPCIPWYSCIVIYKPMIMHHLAQFRWTEYYSFIQPVIKGTSYFCLLSTYIYLRSESQKTKANNISERHKLYKSVVINKGTLLLFKSKNRFFWSWFIIRDSNNLVVRNNNININVVVNNCRSQATTCGWSTDGRWMLRYRLDRARDKTPGHTCIIYQSWKRELN